MTIQGVYRQCEFWTCFRPFYRYDRVTRKLKKRKLLTKLKKKFIKVREKIITKIQMENYTKKMFSEVVMKVNYIFSQNKNSDQVLNSSQETTISFGVIRGKSWVISEKILKTWNYH